MEKTQIHTQEHPRIVSSLGLDPFPWYRHMRETDPIHFNEQLNSWGFFRYNDILYITSHPEIFSSRLNPAQDGSGNLLRVDPPRHRTLRSLVSQAFTPRAIARLSDRISEIVDTQLDKGQETGQLDLITDLAYPLPVIVIAEMLGIPSEERDQFKHWSDQVISGSPARSEAGYTALRDYFRVVLQQRRLAQGDDLVSGLLQARLEDEPLSEDDILDFCVLLLIAGNETTTNLIGNAILCFDECPDAAAELRQDLSLLPTAIEEVVRFRSPVQRFSRMASQDTEIDGRQIKAGQRIFCWVGAANRDAAQFPDPETFSIRRTPNRHLGFGHGIHFCLGAPLARLEAKIAFERMFTRFSDIQLSHEQPLQSITSLFGYGVEHLPVHVTLA